MSSVGQTGARIAAPSASGGTTESTSAGRVSATTSAPAPPSPTTTVPTTPVSVGPSPANGGSGPVPVATPRQAPAQPARGVTPTGPRRVKLTVSRADPWSVMKLSFLISVAIGIAGVVAMAVLWLILNGMGVFTQVNSVLEQLQTSSASTSKFDLMNYIGFGRVVSLSIVIGVIDVILLTALATLGAFLYNVCSSLVGGLQVTLTDD